MNIPTKCELCGGRLWDNREKKASGQFKPKSPDFSCKNKECGSAIWLDDKKKKNNDNAVDKDGWPTDWDHDKPTPEKFKIEDGRSARIERQHSQEMALRYFSEWPPREKESGKVRPPTAKELREMTSWFQRDVGHSSEKESEPGQEIPW